MNVLEGVVPVGAGLVVLLGLLLVEELPFVEVLGEAGGRRAGGGDGLHVVLVVFQLALGVGAERVRGRVGCRLGAHGRQLRVLGRLHGFLPVVAVHRRLLDPGRVVAGDVEVGHCVRAPELYCCDVVRLRRLLLSTCNCPTRPTNRSIDQSTKLKLHIQIDQFTGLTWNLKGIPFIIFVHQGSNQENIDIVPSIDRLGLSLRMNIPKELIDMLAIVRT
jgi:hypothetical protein